MIKLLKQILLKYELIEEECDHIWEIITPEHLYKCGDMPCQRCKHEQSLDGTYYCDKLQRYPVTGEGCKEFEYKKAIVIQCTKCGEVGKQMRSKKWIREQIKFIKNNNVEWYLNGLKFGIPLGFAFGCLFCLILNHFHLLAQY